MLNNKIKAIGLDIGDKRIGVAISDSLGISLKPLPIVNRPSDSEAIQKIIEIIKENDVNYVVYGLPVTLSGEESEQTRKSINFIEKLSSHFMPNNFETCSVEFIPIDERLSSVEAGKILKDKKLKNTKRKEAIDCISAMIVLQNFLDTQHK